MVFTYRTVFFLLAIVLFVLATIRVNSRLDLVAAGLASLALALMLPLVP